MSRQSAVIKAGTLLEVEGRGGLRRFDLNDVVREAREMVVAARVEAERIVESARAEAKVLWEKAREEGRQAGLEEGLREGRETGRHEAYEAAKQEFAEQQKSLIASCEQAIGTINEERIGWAAAARQDLIELAMAIARRVAGRVGERDREVVLANLEEAIRLAGSRSEVRIKVSPVDAAAARDFAESLVSMHKQWEHVEIAEDPEVSPGGCRVQWGTGAVDARLETQLDRIKTELSAGMEVGPDHRDDVTDE